MVLSTSRFESTSSSRRKGVPRAELIANRSAIEAMAFSPPDNYSLLSKTYLYDFELCTFYLVE